MRVASGFAIAILGLTAIVCTAETSYSESTSETVSLLSVAGSGSYEAVMTTDPSLPDHTLYRPRDLEAIDGVLPVVSFGNGACINVGSMYRILLGEIASHGYLVIATGPIGEDPDFSQERETTMPPQAPTRAMLEAIDWAIAENEREGSTFSDRIDADRIAVAGHSCGGLQAIAVGEDPRVDTVAVLNSGIIRGGIPTADGGFRQPAGIVPATEEDLAKLHTPVIYLMGGDTDQASSGADQDFEQIDNVPVFHAVLPVGHGGTWREARGGRMGEVLVAWLDWQLKGDEKDAALFSGEPCGLCVNPDWEVRRKNWEK